jgi:hypothetical protein
MKTFAHLWKYLATFFLEWEMFYIKVTEKIKTHVLYSIIFSRKSYRLWENVEKYSRTRETTNDDTIKIYMLVSIIKPFMS